MGETPESVPLRAVAAPKGLIGGPFGSSLGKKDYVEAGVPVIRGQNLSGPGRFMADGFVFVSEAKAARELSRNIAEPGDVVFTQRGTLGQVGVVPARPYRYYVISQSQMRLRVDASVADADYVYYCFLDPDMQALIMNRAIVTGVPHINLGILSDLPIPLPPLSQQRAIAEVLGALDDKIEANRRMAVTAENLVRAAVSEAQESGGHVVQLGSLVVRVSEVVQPAALPPGTTYVGLEHMPRGSLILEQCGTTENLLSAKAAFSPKDILFGKLRPYFKKVALAAKEGVCSTDILVLRPRGEDWAVAAAVLASDEVIDYATSGSEGTRMPRTSWDYISKCPVRVPGADERDGLQTFIGPILELAVRRAEETSALSLLRDTLLPRLLSGELRVRDAEELVGEAV